MTSHYQFFATAPKYTESLLLEELRSLGADDARETVGGVNFSGDIALAYRVCLWSRIANRVLLNLKQTRISSADDLYDAVYAIDWEAHFGVQQTIAVDFFSSQSVISHTQFGAQKCKDAIVDQFRHNTGTRPDVDKKLASIRINVHAKKDTVSISLDLSGHSLHQRGYRQHNVAAPLKENLAAAFLLRANWPALHAQGYTLVDPMCGSGTIVIEAVCMATNMAPGLLRRDFGFDAWKLHDIALWQQLREQASKERIIDTDKLPHLLAFDSDPLAIQATQQNMALAGVSNLITCQRQEISQLRNLDYGDSGLVICNPPYGERLSDNERLIPLYRTLGNNLKQYFTGWKASIITSDESLAKATGLYAKRINKLYNGNLLCNIYHFDILDKASQPAKKTGTATEPATDQELENRLRKNLKHVQKWASKQQVHCYRVYDADIPEYNFALDLYHSDALYAVLQEYAPPASVDADKAQQRIRLAVATARKVLDIPASQLFLKQRKRQAGSNQYDKMADTRRLHVVQEANCRFYVNFQDYLDTGLFLDHRVTREMIQQMAKGKTFLNLFCYTGTASVHAATGGASSTTSVDMSTTYLNWCQQNFQLNNISLSWHRFIKANCMEWLKTEKRRYDLIFVDPPTFSNSRSMDGIFDIQLHHVELLQDCINLLSDHGQIIFSTNFRRFSFDSEKFPQMNIEDISQRTIPQDFSRNRKIHQCWLLQKKTGA